MNKKIFSITILLYAVFTSSSFAYLDPVTGAVILKFIAWFFAGIVGYCVLFWKKIKLYATIIKKKISSLI